MTRDTLGPFEFQVLAALMRYPPDDYGVKISERIEETTKRAVSIGALYTTLDRLQDKGFVSSRWGEPTAERGGRRKRHYTITAQGQSALYEAVAVQASFAYLDFGRPR